MKHKRVYAIALIVAAVTLGYQNCAKQGLESAKSENTDTASTGGSPTPQPTPTPTMAPPPPPPPPASYSKISGISTANSERPYAVAQGGDLSLYFAGKAQSNLANAATQDAIVAKFSPTGQTVWTKNYGGASQDQFFGLITTSDGKLLAAGQSRSFTGATAVDAYLVKINPADGAVIWSRTYGVAAASESFFALRELANGSIIAVGSTVAGANENALVMSLDATGAIQWTRTFGGAAVDRFEELVISQEGNESRVLAAGYTASYGGANQREGMLVKLDIAGNVIYSRLLGGTVEDRIAGIVQTADKTGYVAVLKTDMATFGGSDTVVARLALDGSTLSQVSISTGFFDEPADVVATSDGRYVVASLVGDNVNLAMVANFDIRLTKFSADLSTILWSKRYGKNLKDEAYFNPLIERKDGGLAMGVISSNYGMGEDALLVQTDANGAVNSATACAEVVVDNQVLAAGSLTNVSFALATATPVLPSNVVATAPLDYATTQLNICMP